MPEQMEVYEPKKRNPMMIKNLCPGLREVGKIKIGNKGAERPTQGGGTFQMPQKLDHFLITTMERGRDNNLVVDRQLHEILGGDNLKEIPVRLIYDDISLNFATRYICYYGKTVFCSGDGEVAQRLQSDKKTYQERQCPCERQDPTFAGDVVNGQVRAGQGKCKINGILQVIIDGAQCVGGVWKFRTTSYNSVTGIITSLALIQRITGGRLAGIPLVMTVSPKSVVNPLDQKQQVIYVVGLEYRGTVETLRATGYQIAMDEAKHGISMQRIEQDALLMISHTPHGGLGDDSATDVIEEFYPEQMGMASAPVIVQPEPAPVILAETAERPAPAEKGPALVAPIEVDGGQIDPSTGEVVGDQEAAKQEQKEAELKADAEKKEAAKRKNAEKKAAEKRMAEEKAAADQAAMEKLEADGETADQAAEVIVPDEQPPHPADDDAGWPAVPGEPVTEPQVVAATPAVPGDLF